MMFIRIFALVLVTFAVPAVAGSATPTPIPGGANQDDVAFAIPTNDVTPSNLNIIQGAAARQNAMCSSTMHFRPFRLSIPQS